MLILQILPGSYPRVTRYCPRLPGCSAFAGAVDFPFLVRNAKFTGSGPAVLRHAVLLNWPVFWLSENVSMVSAAHHCHAAVNRAPRDPFINRSLPGSQLTLAAHPHHRGRRRKRG